MRASVNDVSRGTGERRLVATSFWLYLGFIGASLLASGLGELLDRDASALGAIVLAAAGAVLAVVGWRRGRIAMDSNARRAVDTSFALGPEVTRLGRHARDCAELAAWPEAARRTRPLGRR